MKNYGLSAISEFMGDHIVYRNLSPVDARLPGLRTLAAQLGLAEGGIPRKTQPEYARVISFLLQRAQELRGVAAPIQTLIFIGDTRLLDGTAFINLCQSGGWKGAAFIGSENKEPAAVLLESQPGGEQMFLSNRWAALPDFDRFCRENRLPGDETTAVVIDMDKTSLGARGRNAHTIDRARVKAVQHTVADLLGQAFDPQQFQQAYDLFNQVEFHPFTADNQDYLAYICLMLGAGVGKLQSLATQVRERKLNTFDEYIAMVEQQKNALPLQLAAIHEDIYRWVKAGDPTPFKAFRRNEYRLTVAAMGYMSADTPVEQLLRDEILLTQEVRAAALTWKERGALIFGLSDKPDEASNPTPELAEKGYLPLHRTLTHAVGSV